MAAPKRRAEMNDDFILKDVLVVVIRCLFVCDWCSENVDRFKRREVSVGIVVDTTIVRS